MGGLSLKRSRSGRNQNGFSKALFFCAQLLASYRTHWQRLNVSRAYYRANSLLLCIGATLSAHPHWSHDTGATLDEFREAVTTYEEIEPTARRVLGGAHPATRWIECSLRHARAELATRETAPPGTA